MSAFGLGRNVFGNNAVCPVFSIPLPPFIDFRCRYSVLRLDIDIDLMNYSILKCTLRFDKILFLFFQEILKTKKLIFT